MGQAVGENWACLGERLGILGTLFLLLFVCKTGRIVDFS